MAMISTADEAREAINKLGTDMQALLAKAREEKREPTDDEKHSFDTMDVAREEAIKAERRYLRLAELEGSNGRQTRQHQPTAELRDSKGPVEVTSLERLETLRAWLLAGSTARPSAGGRAAATKSGVDLAARNLELLLPHTALRSTRSDEIARWQQRIVEQRALSAGSTSSPVDGAYTVPDEMMRPLEEALLSFGGMRVKSTILRTDTGADLPIPTVNDTGNKGEILGENMQVHQLDVAFNQLVLESYKYSSKMILVSVELLQDNAINLAEFLGRALGTRIGRITNDHFTTGTGTAEPRGILTATTASGTQFAALTPTYAEMVGLQHAIDPAYRSNAGVGWMFHDSMLAQIKSIVDASTGRPIWMPGMTGGAPDTILGDPYVINQSMPSAAGSGAGKSVVYGDLSKYLIRDVRAITLLRLDERFADYHQVAFLAFSRHDGDLLDAGTHPVKHALNKA